MKFKHEGIIFSNREIEHAKKNLNKAAYKQLRAIADKALSYRPKIPNNPLAIPRFYGNKAAWRKAVYHMEASSKAMISCANMYRLTDDPKYAKKVIQIAKAWTGKITSYATHQAQFDANWNFQTMATAGELVRDYAGDSLDSFFKWTRDQCLTLKEALIHRFNNHVYWLGAHIITNAITNEDEELFELACDIYKRGIRNGIAKDGHMMKETVREFRGIHYTFFALDALTFIAEAAKHQGRDLFSYTYKGESLLTATKYIIPFVKHPKKWPWISVKQDCSIFPHIHSGWCEIAYGRWRLRGIKEFLGKYRPLFDFRLGGAQTLFHGK